MILRMLHPTDDDVDDMHAIAFPEKRGPQLPGKLGRISLNREVTRKVIW